MKKIIALLLGLFMALAAGCGSSGSSARGGEKVLRVGVDPDYPPFEFYQESSRSYTGFDVDLIHDLARQMGYSRVEYESVEFESLIYALKEKKIDAAISCMTITPERLKEVDFSDPYLKSDHVVVSPFGREVRDLDSLSRKMAAVEKDSIQEEIVKEHYGFVVTTSSADEAMKAVLDGKADFAIMDEYVALFACANQYNGKLAVTYKFSEKNASELGIAVRKGDKELLRKINEGLKDYKKSANFDMLMKTYFGQIRKS